MEQKRKKTLHVLMNQKLLYLIKTLNLTIKNIVKTMYSDT